MRAPKYNDNRVVRHRIGRIANQKISLLNGLNRKFVMPPINENFGWMLSRPEELKAERRHYLDLIEGQTRHR